jgi:hypothetical protein
MKTIRASVILALAGATVLVAAQSGRPTREVPRSTPAGVAAQVERLAHSDPIERAFAACFLADMGRRAAPALPALIRLLGDETAIDPVVCRRDGVEGSWSVRVNALQKTTPGREAARAAAAVGRGAFDDLV